MVKLSKILSVSRQRMLHGKLAILLIFLAICVIGRTAKADTSIYVFDPNQSTVRRSGGIAGLQKTFAVAGQFHLIVDLEAGIASFEKVDANLTDETGSIYGQSLDEIFNMTGLSGTIIDDTIIQFEGKTADGTESDVSLKLTLGNDSAQLTGSTTPPPNSADMFLYEIDAVAAKKYDGGTGEPNDPYLIYTAEHLNTIGTEPNDLDKHFKLMADIDLSGYSYDRAVIASDTNDAELWFQGNPFTGVFNGNGYVISNLHVRGLNYLGLFGKIDLAAKISSLGMEATDVNGIGEYIGSLVGWDEGNISMSYSTGTVSGTGANVGGLVGFNLGSITMSYSACVVSGIISVGGLVGYNIGDLTGCYSAAVVNGSLHAGGLVGYNQNGSIITSFSSGTTNGDMSVGGLAGWNWGGVITQCYSTGIVTGNFDVGGLLGSDAEGHVTYCYSTGMVGGESSVGGLLGYGVDSNVTNCFWDTETSAQTTSAGGTGETTAEMQMSNTYLDAGWDFVDETVNGTEDIWSICEGTNYPRLVWQIPAGDFVCPDGITLDDFLFFLEHWLDDNCDSSNDYCQGTDFDQSGTVDVIDLEIFFENWPAEK